MQDQPGRGLVPHSPDATGIPLGASPPATFDWTNIKPKNTLFPGTNQGSSGTCQTQAFKMAVKRATGLDISVEYIYSHIFLPGGGGYLIAPAQFTNSDGYVLTSKHPDPSPQTEKNMEILLQIPDGDIMRTFIVTAVISSVDTIDAVATAIMAHDAAIIGIYWTESGWAKSWMHPTYEKGDATQDGHALCTVMPQLLTGSTDLKQILCETSWQGVEGPDGPCTHHVIDENYFANGGVFELLTLDFKEITQMLTTKTINLDGTIGVIVEAQDEADLPYLNTLFGKTLVSDLTGKIATDITAHAA
jgi:hypothetical protein